MPSSLIDFKDWTPTDCEDLFSLAQALKQKPRPANLNGATAALLFFEPSTRTRMSFEIAAIRCGLGAIVLDGPSGTSMEKGESIEDTILNIAAMQPEFMIIRCGDVVPLAKLAEQITSKVINAGWGVKAHPSQALLDALTIKEHFRSWSGRKLLIVGDVKHSRVASSHLELLPKLGMEVAVCGPQEFLDGVSVTKKFAALKEGLQWADAVMALRVQFERHDSGLLTSKADYAVQFGLSLSGLKEFGSQGIIMHPGPINHGVEMAPEVLQDPRCRVFQQVTNGVFIREALIRWLRGEKA